MQKMNPELHFIEPMECLNVLHLIEGANWQYEVRSGAWQKHKTQPSDDFVIGGYSDGGNGRVDEIAVGECKDGKLLFVEAVKNGFVPATRREVFQTIANLQVPDCPFVNLPEKKGAHRMDEEKMQTFHWVKPKVMAEIAFNNRTTLGHLRHSRFLRLRPDKKFAGCTKRKAQ